MRLGERGALLLEAMVALAILLAAGVSVVSLLGNCLAGQATLSQREAEATDLDRLLAAMSLLTSADLDQRLGRHEVGRWTADVERPEPGLYRLALSRCQLPHLPGSGLCPAERSVEALVTVVYRPAPALP